MKESRNMVGTAVAMILVNVLAAGGTIEHEEGTVTPYARAADACRYAWHRMEAAGKSGDLTLISEAQKALASTQLTGAFPGAKEVTYLRIRALALRGEYRGIDGEVASSLATATAVESVLLLMQRSADKPSLRDAYAELLAELAPVSAWRRQVDANRASTGVYVFVKPDRAVVPRTDRSGMVRLAGCLDEAGLYDLAWRAYAEAVYGSYSPGWIRQGNSDTWMSADAAKHWRSAADSARKAGKEELAWDFLMKAAVYGKEEMYAECKQTARTWSLGMEHPEPTKTPRVDRKRQNRGLMEAIQLCEALNAHPRALSLIEDKWEVLERPDERRKDTEENWIAVVKDLSRATDKVVLYGYEVYPNGDPLKVRIPWALSDEALASVRKRLAALKTGK